MNKKTKTETILKLVPQKTLHVTAQRNGKTLRMKRFVHTNGIIAGEDFAKEIGVPLETIKKVYAGIERCLRCAYEVRPCGMNTGTRYYPFLRTDYKTIDIIAQTIGDFRHSISDMHTITTHNNALISDTEKDHGTRADFMLKTENKRIAEEKRFLACVTPDKMVTCPKCGESFRVGKVLGNK